MFLPHRLLRTLRTGTLLLAIGLAIAPSTAEGQISAADSAAVLLATGQAFEDEEQWEHAEAIYRFILRQFPGTPTADLARTRLTDGRVFEGGSGSTELQVWATTYGLWLGVAIPGALGADDSEPYGLGLLLGGPAGFMAGRNIARSRNLSIGQARAITLGGTWGTWQGYGWREVFDIGQDEFCDPFGCYSGGGSSEETFAAMVLGGLAGITAGAFLARQPIANSTATAANFGSLFGSWFGVASGILLDLDEGDDGLLAITLLGGNAGLAAGALAAPRLGWSRSRWRVVSITSLLGGLGGAGIDLLTQPDNENVAIAIPLVTSIIGLGVGVHTSRNDPAGAGSPEPDIPALLTMKDGRLGLGGLVPRPMLRTEYRPDGTRRVPALGFDLLRIVF